MFKELVSRPAGWKLIRNVSRNSVIYLLPFFAVLIFSTDAFGQCQYDWRQEAFPTFGSRQPSPEVNMSDENKIRISRACDKLFKDFIDSALRPDPNHWRDTPYNCQELAPRGRTDVKSLNSARYTRYYKPLRHPRSIERDPREVSKWYSLFDCPTRQAIRLLELRNIWIPSGLIVYRIPKPGRDYQSPTIIPRTDAWKPIGHIIIPEFYDREFLRYAQDMSFHGVILSSIGEIIHERKAGEFYYTLSGKRPRNGGDVSPRARDSAYHFVADVFAGWVVGKRY